MGPAATADMLEKFVELRHASCDQQHIPLIVSSIPDIPDRTACLLSGGPSPYRYLERYLHMLEDAGAECIVIPCNTAHYWFDDLQNVAKARMISIPTLPGIFRHRRGTLVCWRPMRRWRPGYIKESAGAGLTLIQPEDAGQALVMQAIYTLKRGDKTAAQALLLPQIDSLIARGAQAIIMGCTEIPLIVAGHERAIACPMIDSTASLVRAAIRWYESRRTPAPL